MNPKISIEILPPQQRSHIKYVNNLKKYPRNGKLQNYDNYPTTSVPADWFHPFNIDYSKATALTKKRRVFKSFDTYIENYYPSDITTVLIEKYKYKIAESNQPPANVKRTVENEFMRELYETTNDSVLTDIVTQVHQIKLDVIAKRVARTYYQKWLQKKLDKFRKLIPEAITDEKIRQAKRVLSLSDPARFTKEEIVLTESELQVPTEDEQIYKSVAYHHTEEIANQ